jgi:putative transposase
MAEERMTLTDVLRKGEASSDDLLRTAVEVFVRILMDAEVSAQIGAGRYERTAERVTQRKGDRTRSWDTRLGTLELQIPKLRAGSSFPSWLEPRRRSEQARVAVVAEAYLKGGSTRKVEAVVQTLGIASLSRGRSVASVRFSTRRSTRSASGALTPTIRISGSPRGMNPCAKMGACSRWP